MTPIAFGTPLDPPLLDVLDLDGLLDALRRRLLGLPAPGSLTRPAPVRRT